MPRPRKTQPLPDVPVIIGARQFVPPVSQLHTRTLIRAVASDDRDVAVEAAESVANECVGMLEASGATILSVATQALCMERFTRWQFIVTIVYREAVNVVA